MLQFLCFLMAIYQGREPAGRVDKEQEVWIGRQLYDIKRKQLQR